MGEEDEVGALNYLTTAEVAPIAERGVVGRGILLDIARLRGKENATWRNWPSTVLRTASTHSCTRRPR